MNKMVLIIALLFISFSAFAEEPPISGFGWKWDNNVTLNGRSFSIFQVAESYREQDGFALVQEGNKYRRVHYWLYDTVSYHSGNTNDIYNRYIPHWIEKRGYVIDFDNIKIVNPNPDLASSVMALMQQRGCDISVALVTDSSNHDYVVINEYFKSKGTYKTTFYYLY